MPASGVEQDGRFGAGLGAEFAHPRADVGLDRLGGDAQDLGDAAGGVAGGHMGQHFDFALGESAGAARAAPVASHVVAAQ
ncbi:hypothetical protein GCM10029992_44840 [Glycomyces albus]